MKELIAIQSELNVPKSEYNSFSKFSYRTAEGILAALKPILTKYNCFINLSDNIELIGDRYYVHSKVALFNSTGVNIGSSSGFAREEEHKKGMDGSQITGAASSYARKYALNGLFAIDDTKDADDPALQNNEPEVREPRRTTRTRSRATIPAVAIDEVPAETIEPELPEELQGPEELTPKHKNWKYTVKRVAEGFPIEKVKEVFKLDSKNERILTKEVNAYQDETTTPSTGN